MADAIESKIDGRTVKIYPSEGDGLPIFYSNDYSENGEAVLAKCKEIGCPPFHLVTISGFEWDECMSPWPSEQTIGKNDDFKGGAPKFLEWLLENVVPYAERELALGNPKRFISGYSMGGLFALWSLYNTEAFSGALSASGSVWFPGFEDYALAKELMAEPEAIYMSLGTKETRVKAPALQHTDSVYEHLLAHYRSLGIESTFESNPGNHFTDVILRLAKGYKWMLEAITSLAGPTSQARS